MQQNFTNILFTIFLSVIFIPIFAQNGENPFDLTPRLKQKTNTNLPTKQITNSSSKETTTTPASSDKNPFDLNVSNGSSPEKISDEPAASTIITDTKNTSIPKDKNPFDLDKNSTSSPETITEQPVASTIDKTDTLTTENSNNPFDLIDHSSEDTATRIQKDANAVASDLEKSTPLPKIAEKILPLQPDQEKPNKRFLAPVVMFMLALLALLVTLFRSVVAKTYQAFLNDNILSIVYRERSSILISPYTVLYLMFLINAGIFIFLLAEYYQVSIANHRFLSLMLSIGLVFAIFLLKHLVIQLLAFIFPIEKELKLYNFTIVIFGIIIGILLVPANILIAYAPPTMTSYLVYTALGLVGLVYLFRSLRGLFIANRFLLFHKFHFLLYICTVEIAPMIVFLKLLST